MKLLLDDRAPRRPSQEILAAGIPEALTKPAWARGCPDGLRLVLGGSLCGWFLGIFAGALVGSLYGIWVNDISLGLDGALVGGAILAILGVGYGLGCGAGVRAVVSETSESGTTLAEAEVPDSFSSEEDSHKREAAEADREDECAVSRGFAG